MTMRPPAHAAHMALAAVLVLLFAGRPAAAQEDSLIVRDFVVARAIVDREPVDVGDTFTAADGRAFAFLRAENTGPPTTVTFVWYRNGAFHAVVTLTVGTSPGWRTWSSARLRPGEWRVDLVDESGRVLAQRHFVVQ